jgi:hypothetical protein
MFSSMEEILKVTIGRAAVLFAVVGIGFAVLMSGETLTVTGSIWWGTHTLIAFIGYALGAVMVARRAVLSFGKPTT